MRALCSLAQIRGEPNRQPWVVAADWARILSLAERHGTAALVLRNLAAGDLLVPQAIFEQLEELCRSAVKKSLLMSAELIRLCERFKAAGLRAACYKGPALGAALYGDAALRPCSDLDFLLSLEDLGSARTLLLELGYAALLPLDEEQQQRQARRQGALVFVNPQSTTAVDLHFEIVPRHLAMKLPLKPMLERAGEIEFIDSKMLFLQPEDLLLTLCVHGSKHHWERLLWICDVAQTLKRYPEMDWELLLERADKARIRRVLLLGVALAGELLGAESPKAIAFACERDKAIPKLISAVAKRLEAEPSGGGAEARRWMFMLRSRERQRDRIAAVLRYALSPRLG